MRQPVLGIYGFGAAAHIITQVARHQGRRVFAFTRAGDEAAQGFARALGAEWAGDALGPAPEELDAAILFAPAGEHVPAALRAVAKGGTVVSAGIHMSDIPSFFYEILWGERVVRSVANLTRGDGEEFLAIAPRVPVHTTVEAFALGQANRALGRLRGGTVLGAVVLAVDPIVPTRSERTGQSGATARILPGERPSGSVPIRLVAVLAEWCHHASKRWLRATVVVVLC